MALFVIFVASEDVAFVTVELVFVAKGNISSLSMPALINLP